MGALGGAAFATLLLVFPAVVGLFVVLYYMLFGPSVPSGELRDVAVFALQYIGSGAGAGAAAGLVWKVIPGRIGFVFVGVVALAVFMIPIITIETGPLETWGRSTWMEWAGFSLFFGIPVGWVLGWGESYTVPNKR
jgi:hypothetical protein